MSTTIPSSTIDQENLNPANLQPPTVNLEERPASVCSANDEGSASQRPFVCKFKTRNHFYVYDVNRNTILEVTPATYAIVDDYGSDFQNRIALPQPTQLWMITGLCLSSKLSIVTEIHIHQTRFGRLFIQSPRRSGKAADRKSTRLN